MRTARGVLVLIAAASLSPFASGEENRATLHLETDALMALATGPHTTTAVTRNRYFRLYHFPGMYTGELAAELRWLRVAPGRGTGPFFGDDGGDSRRFGMGNSAQATIENFVEMAGTGSREHAGAPYAAAGGSFPVAPRDGTVGGPPPATVDPTMKVAHNRAVRREDREHAVGLIVQWLDAMQLAGVPKPAFFSPVNEPDASWKGDPHGTAEHAAFARDLAIRLKSTHPDVRVSGPCTAWPYPGPDWKRWEPSGWERTFIETAGDVAGAYDFHFYTKDLWAYGPDSPGYQPARKLPTPNLFESQSLGHTETMEFGKADVLLDLVQALHLAKWGRPAPPVVVSEFGRQGITPQLGPWANEFLYNLYATTVTRMWMLFMDRPEIALTVPFILPESDPGYGPRRGQALATRPGAPADLTTIRTPLADWLAFFRTFEGERVPTRWETGDAALSRGLFAIAVREQDAIQVLLHNAAPDPVNVSLAAKGLPEWPSQARVARVRWEGPEPADHLSPNPEGANWRRDTTEGEILGQPRLRLEAEETALVRLPLSAPPSRQVLVSRVYSPEFLQSLEPGKRVSFSFELTPGMLANATEARLVLGFSAPRGPEQGDIRLRVGWDGAASQVTSPTGIDSGWRHVAVPVAVEVPVQDLKPGKWTVHVEDGSETPVSGSRIVSARVDVRTERPITSPISPQISP